jgi:hypothetical protein
MMQEGIVGAVHGTKAKSTEPRGSTTDRCDQNVLRTTLGCVLTSQLLSGSVKYFHNYKIKKQLRAMVQSLRNTL